MSDDPGVGGPGVPLRPAVPAGPRPWVERAYHVTYWNELPRGGHFAAMEQPELFAADLTAYGVSPNPD